MPSTSIICGVLLILLGIFGYALGLMDGHASPTALIPAAFGLLLLIFGFLAKSKENLRKHLMHTAVLVALIGFLIPTIRLIPFFREFFSFVSPPPSTTNYDIAKSLTISPAIVSQFLMALICLVFVILSVKSFIDARRNRVV